MAISALLAPTANADPVNVAPSNPSQASVSASNGNSSPSSTKDKGVSAGAGQKAKDSATSSNKNHEKQPSAAAKNPGSQAAPRDGEVQQATIDLTLTNKQGTYDKSFTAPVGQNIDNLVQKMADEFHIGTYSLIGAPPAYKDDQGNTFYYHAYGLWNTKQDGTGNYLPEQTDAIGNVGTGFTPTEPKAYHFYYVWEKYVVSFDFDDSYSSEPGFGTYVNQTTVKAPYADGTYGFDARGIPQNSVFVGWNTKQDGTGTFYKAGSTVTPGQGGVELTTDPYDIYPTQNATLYAQFSSEKTVTLDYGNARADAAFKKAYDNGHFDKVVVRDRPEAHGSVTYAEDKDGDVKLPLDGDFNKTFTDSNGHSARYQLLGWSADPNSLDPQYKPGDTVMQADIPQNGMSLYAIWAQYKVQFLKGAVDAEGQMPPSYLGIVCQGNDNPVDNSLKVVPRVDFTLPGETADSWLNGSTIYRSGVDSLVPGVNTEFTRTAPAGLTRDAQDTYDDDIDMTAQWVKTAKPTGDTAKPTGDTAKPVSSPSPLAKTGAAVAAVVVAAVLLAAVAWGLVVLRRRRQ